MVRILTTESLPAQASNKFEYRLLFQENVNLTMEQSFFNYAVSSFKHILSFIKVLPRHIRWKQLHSKFDPRITNVFDCRSRERKFYRLTKIIDLTNQGWVVQRRVTFYPGLRKSYSNTGFSQEIFTVLIKQCSGFPREKLVNPKFSNQIRLCKVGNKTMG